MALAFDAFSSSAAGTGNLSWTHTPVGTPRAVIVFVEQVTGTTDEVTSVDYGSLSLGEVVGSPHLKTTTEVMGTHCFFSGAAIPTGAQTVLVTVSGANSKRAAVITLTAAADCEVQDTDATIQSTSLANPSATLALGGAACFCAQSFGSGQAAVGGITPLTGWTSRLENDWGSQTSGWYTYDTIGTADVTMGWTQTADDANCIGIAVKEVGGAPEELVNLMLLLGVGR